MALRVSTRLALVGFQARPVQLSRTHARNNWKNQGTFPEKVPCSEPVRKLEQEHRQLKCLPEQPPACGASRVGVQTLSSPRRYPHERISDLPSTGSPTMAVLATVALTRWHRRRARLAGLSSRHSTSILTLERIHEIAKHSQTADQTEICLAIRCTLISLDL